MTTVSTPGVDIDSRAVRAIVEFGAQQKAAELSALVTFLQRRRLSSVLEIGSWSGGTLWLWAQLADTVVSIDVSEIPTAHIDRPVMLVRGDSRSWSTWRAVAGLVFDMVFIDGDHHYAGAASDWAMYSPLVKLGGIAVLHDIATHDPGVECEVDRLWMQLKDRHDTREFVIPHDPPTDPPIHPNNALPERGAGIGVVLL